MDARIGHVTDARDTRPAWGITYRRFVDVTNSHVRVQADNLDSALAALAGYIGSDQYAVTSIRAEQTEDSMDKTPLQKIQDQAAAAFLMHANDRVGREQLDAFLVQAFDAGVAAARGLDAEAKKPSKPSAKRSVWTIR